MNFFVYVYVCVCAWRGHFKLMLWLWQNSVFCCLNQFLFRISIVSFGFHFLFFFTKICRLFLLPYFGSFLNRFSVVHKANHFGWIPIAFNNPTTDKAHIPLLIDLEKNQEGSLKQDLKINRYFLFKGKRHAEMGIVVPPASLFIDKIKSL